MESLRMGLHGRLKCYCTGCRFFGSGFKVWVGAIFFEGGERLFGAVFEMTAF